MLLRTWLLIVSYNGSIYKLFFEDVKMLLFALLSGSYIVNVGF